MFSEPQVKALSSKLSAKHVRTRQHPGPHPYADPGDIGTGAPVPLHPLPDTLHRHGLPVPGVIAEDPVGLRDGMPALDIGEGEA